MMKRLVTAMILVVAFFGHARPALAGPYADDMVKCFVRSTSDADKADLVKWIFAIAALHPAVAPIATVTEAQRTDMNKRTARLFERLLTESCGAESRTAYKFEGPGVLPAAFQSLAQLASTTLFSNAAVSGGTAGLGAQIDAPMIQQFLEGK